MALSDIVAQQVMGEIDDLTKRIDGQMAIVIESGRVMQENIALLGTTLSAVSALPDEVAKKCTIEVDKYANVAARTAQNIVSVEIAKAMAGLVETAKQGIRTASEDIADLAKAKAITMAWKVAGGGVLACSVVFTSLGYALRNISEHNELANSRAEVVSVRAAAAATVANAKAEIDTMAKSIGWFGTKEGQTARKFFDSSLGGMGMEAATCAAANWEIVQAKNGKWCVPKLKPFFGGDDKKYGWKMP